MPIHGRSEVECVEQFRNVLGKLFNQVVHKTRPVRAMKRGNKFIIGVIDDYGTVQPLKLARDSAAPLYARLWQEVEIVSEKSSRGRRAFRLRTSAYNYHLFSTDDVMAEAVLRWEYVKVRQSGSSLYCRNHLQGTFEIPGSQLFDFKKMHLPTSYVLLEEVLRFFIVELGHRPPCGDNWDAVLEESKKKFHEQLSSKPAKYDAEIVDA